MELEQLIQLINTVSESKLTDFRYEENGVKLCLKKDGGRASGTMPTVQEVLAAGTVQAVPGALAAGTAQAVPGALAAGTTQVTASEALAAGTAQVAAGAMSAVAGVSAVGTAQAEAALSPDAKIVKSPLVGVFYAAPAEDAKPYVSVGDTVKKGQILACVEAMKLMNEIESEYDGVVAEILAENGQGVGYGEPLFVIR